MAPYSRSIAIAVAVSALVSVAPTSLRADVGLITGITTNAESGAPQSYARVCVEGTHMVGRLAQPYLQCVIADSTGAFRLVTASVARGVLHASLGAAATHYSVHGVPSGDSLDLGGTDTLAGITLPVILTA